MISANGITARECWNCKQATRSYRFTERCTSSFEGLTGSEIRADPKNIDWDIWTQGCPEGETPGQVSDRVDRLVQSVRNLHIASMRNREERTDVVLIAHSHILRCFLAKWTGSSIQAGKYYILDAGGLSVGGYEYGLHEPAIIASNINSLEKQPRPPVS